MLLFNYPKINRHLCKLSLEKQNFSDNSFLFLTLAVAWGKAAGIIFSLSCKIFSVWKYKSVALFSKCNSWGKLALSVQKVIWNLEQQRPTKANCIYPGAHIHIFSVVKNWNKMELQAKCQYHNYPPFTHIFPLYSELLLLFWYPNMAICCP